MYRDIAPPTFVVFAAPYAAFTTTSPHAARFGQRQRAAHGEEAPHRGSTAKPEVTSGTWQVREDVDDVAVRVFDEEPPDSPRLVGQGIDDAQPSVVDASVQSIDGCGVAHIDPEVGLRAFEAARADEQLRGGQIRGLETYDGSLHCNFQAEDLGVEAPRGVGIIRFDVGVDALDQQGVLLRSGVERNSAVGAWCALIA
jgi:hypothetical protein